jgi:hypothetical protein
MTDNHLLLYRLAELTLEHEQNTLPVDLLFDDKQIGDFVKSIQIDSPYQQMLFEGVLTETVRDEKLYVSFTVEGYFHFVLGEVIFTKAKGKNAEYLKELSEKIQLNGIREGIENCLNKDISIGDSSRLIELIDHGGEMLNLIVKPLTNLFLNNKIIQKTKTKEEAIIDHVSFVISELFSNSTDNDIKAINEILKYLDKNEKK